MSKQILILDSSQIDTFLECPQLHNFSYTQSLTFSGIEEKDAMAMGTLGHKWLEHYYHGKTMGWTQALCVGYANNMNPDVEDKDPNDAGHFPLDAEKRKHVKKRCQDYWMTYSQNDYTPDYEMVYDIKIDENGMPVDSTIRKPLIERGFSYKLYESNEYLFILEGRIDFIGTHNYNRFFMDHKFQLRERKLYPKSIQFKNYAMVTGLNLGIINYIRLHQTVNDKTFVREPISFSSLDLIYWKKELITIYIEVAEQMRKGKFQRRWNACSGKYGYACQFTSICEEHNPQVGELIKIQNYKKKKEWKPW